MKAIKAMNQGLMDKFEVKGEWKLPTTQHVTSGTLFYSKDKIQLELFGKLDPEEKRIDNKLKSPEVIWGVSEAGEEFTLISTVRTKSRSHLGNYEFNLETYESQQLLVGKHINDIETCIFESMSIEFTYLPEWLGIQLFHTNINPDSYENSIKTITPELFEIEILNIDAVIKSSGFLKFNNDFYRKAEIVSVSTLKLVPREMKNFGWFKEQLYTLQKLMTLLAGRSIYVESILFKGEEIEQSLPFHHESSKISSSYKWFFKQGSVKIKENINTEDFLMSYKDIKKDFGVIVNKWFEKKEKLDVVFELYTGEFFKNTHLTTSFSNFMQAIEAFHRRNYDSKLMGNDDFEKFRLEFNKYIDQNAPSELKDKLKGTVKYGNELSLKRRLVELVNTLSLETKELFFGDGDEKNIKKFLQKLVDTRNYLTHYDMAGKSNVINTDNRFYAIQRLKAFLTLLLIKELDINEVIILEKIQKSTQLNYFLRKANTKF